ncbi:4'-phosphopantetheinyl transferase family protein [Streptomyces sp. NBC_01618]|uniref:4'-phosphopantetheinyl transferase family protein n=1 Tax=Streptomyces sp. NBC_01618 TaxID=2975900 RepID=UPI0038651D69|nr:4'-phosphopantetheinyl transferase superfamily protein [Streptomyces sp. NBC_01618]
MTVPQISTEQAAELPGIRGAADGATVWWWRGATTVLTADLALLDDSELRRLGRIRSPAGAAEFVGNRASVRRILAGLLGAPPERIHLGRRPCPGCGDPEHGPPTILNPQVMCWISISHTSGCGMLAVAGAPVGVDVERARDIRVDELAPTTLTPSEVKQLDGLTGDALRQAFLRCWTRKEAALKAVGVGITVPLDRVETHPATAGTITVAAGVPGTPQAWSVTDLPIPTPWTASVALPAGTAGPVRLRAHPGN